MIQFKNVTKIFSDQKILDCVDWQVHSGDRIGLCGENGAGKTTILRLLAGAYETDSGAVVLGKETTVGYLPQEGLQHSGRILVDEVQTAFEGLLKIEKHLRVLEQKISQHAESSDLEKYAELQAIFEQHGGFTMEAEIGKVLKGLGFSEEDWQRPCEFFSGGWQMRIALAKLLLKTPNLLLLDEPTNHLDLPARDWLEEYLSAYPHTVIVVSHDRFFLDQVVTGIVEVWNAQLTDYPGNYSQYLAARNERVSALRKAKARQDEEIAKIEAFISKFRYNANKAALVQSRIRMLEKIERIQLPPERKKIGFSFPSAPKSGGVILDLKAVSHGYENHPVFKNVELLIERGEKVALVGANGAGKSTLMRLLAGVEKPQSGNRKEGHNVLMAYFAQDQANTLDPKTTVLDQVIQSAPYDMVPNVRKLLGAFLFHGDDVFKKISVLSGGEKNRLALAILLLKPANLLLLDEPTNHLDLSSKEVLLHALKNYSGTMVFVSHDRYFVDALATRVIEVSNQKILSHPGNYEDFIRFKNRLGDLSHSVLRVEQTTKPLRKTSADGDNKSNYLKQKTAQRELKKWKKELAALEERIMILEEKIEDICSKMHDPSVSSDHQSLNELAILHDETSAELEEKISDWAALQERLATEEPQ